MVRTSAGLMAVLTCVSRGFPRTLSEYGQYVYSWFEAEVFFERLMRSGGPSEPATNDNGI
jgi:hypothetical protein